MGHEARMQNAVYHITTYSLENCGRAQHFIVMFVDSVEHRTLHYLLQFAGTKLADKSALEEEPESDEEDLASATESNSEQNTSSQTNGKGGGESEFLIKFLTCTE